MGKKIQGTLIILTMNEIEGLRKIFPKMPIGKIEEVIAIDYNSTDGTLEFFRKNKIRVIEQKIKGRGEAFRIGVSLAKYEDVVFFSPDGNEDPEDIIKIFRYLSEGYGMVIASRFMKGSVTDDKDSVMRYRSFGNRFFTMIANILWDGHLTDSINGFRGIKKKEFMKIKPNAHGFGIEFQISIRALKKKIKIKEFPTKEYPRIGGRSTAGALKVGWLFIKLIASELFNRKG